MPPHLVKVLNARDENKRQPSRAGVEAMSARRELSFESLDDVRSDLDRLLAGHVTVGNWSLGQILYHLRAAFEVPLEGDPTPGEMTRAHDVIRRRFFSLGRFPEGRDVPNERFLPTDNLDDRAEADSFRNAVSRFERSTGPYQLHPGLGPLTKDEWRRFHLIHCAHHLSFVLPTDVGNDSRVGRL
jgi:hypothetical protein